MRACAALAVLLLGALTASAAPRLSLVPELSLGAGYDDNLFLDPAQSGATSAPPRADAIFDVHPGLLAGLVAGGHALTLDADFLERITVSNGELRDLLLRIDWAAPLWHRLRPSLAALYEHYEATAFPDNRFDLGGGEAALRLVLRAWWLQAGYRFDVRAYGDPARNGQQDLEQWATLATHARLHRLLLLDFAYRFLHVGSNALNAELDRHRLELLFTLQPSDRWLLSAGYAIWTQHLPRGGTPPDATTAGGPRDDWAHQVALAVDVRPLAWLDLFARYTWTRSTSTDSPGRYQVNQVVAGVAFSWPLAHRPAPPPHPFLPTVQGGAVVFRAQARPGAQVAVLGDWNGWHAQPLAPVGGDRYQVTLPLPPGRHAYTLSIDGVVGPPPEAAAWADDGFGGRNAVVDVPGAPP